MKYFTTHLYSVRNIFDTNYTNLLKVSNYFFNKSYDNFEFLTSIDQVSYVQSISDPKFLVKTLDLNQDNPFKSSGFLWKWPKYLACSLQKEPFTYFDNDILVYDKKALEDSESDFLFFSKENYAGSKGSEYLKIYGQGLSVLHALECIPPSLKDLRFDVPVFDIYDSSVLACNHPAVYKKFYEELVESLEIFVRNREKIFDQNPDSNFIKSVTTSVLNVYEKLLLSKIVNESGYSASSLYKGFNTGLGLPAKENPIKIAHISYFKNDPATISNIVNMTSLLDKKPKLSENKEMNEEAKIENFNPLTPELSDQFFKGENLEAFKDGTALFEQFEQELTAKKGGCSSCAKNRIKRKFVALLKVV